MESLFWMLVVLGIVAFVLSVITFVGHGIWVLIAKIAGAAKGSKAAGGSAGPEAELHVTEFQINRLTQAGLLDEPTRMRVIGAIRAARTRQRRPVQTPPPVPVLPLIGQPVGARESAPIPPTTAVTPGEPCAACPTIPAPTHATQRPLSATAKPRPILQPAAPARPFSEVLASFMRQSNIRWGELIGGLLIVGCSVALVISFWSHIRGHAFFEFGLFTSVTAALMGLGLYAEHRWKLPTTSRGILLIATLLVPLNFVAFAALAHGNRPPAIVSLGEVAALGLFGALVWRAAIVLTPQWCKPLCVGVVGLSASLLAIQHLGPGHSTASLLALAGLPVSIHLAVSATALGQARRWQRIHAHVSESLFLLLGVLNFGAALGLALVIFQTEAPWMAAHRIVPLLSLAAAPALATGILMWRRVSSRKLAGVRTAGTAIALSACLLMVGLLGLAWPDARSILPLAAADFLAFTLVSLAFDFPVLHAMGGLCLIVAWLVGYHVAARHVGWTSTPHDTWAAICSPAGGAALVPLFGFAASASLLLRLRHRFGDARVYCWISVAVAAISLALTTLGGFARAGDPFGATWVYLIYAAIAFVVGSRWRRTPAAWSGWLLLLAALVQFVAGRQSAPAGWSDGLLAYASIAILARLLAARIASDRLTALVGPAQWLGGLASLAAALLLATNLSVAWAGWVWPDFAWLAAVWIATALAEESPDFFAAGQLALAASAAAGAVWLAAEHAWFRLDAQPLLEPWTLQSIAISIALLNVAWALARHALPAKLSLRKWLESAWSMDRILTLALLGGLAILAGFGVAPGVAAELATGPITLSLPAAAHAAGIGSWVLLGTLLLTLSLWLRERIGPAALLLLVGGGCIACTLWAARWNDLAAGASALRWALAAYLLVLSGPLWATEELPLAGERFAGSRRRMRTVAFALAALPILVLSIYPAGLTLGDFHVAGPLPASFFAKIGNTTSYCVPLVLIAAVCIGNAFRDRSPAWAFLGSLVLNLTATLGYALAVVSAGRAIDWVAVVRLVQINALAFAGFALGWQVVRAIRDRTLAPAARLPGYMAAQLVAAGAGIVLLLIAGAGPLVLAPGWPHPSFAVIASPLGWATLLAVLGAIAWARRARAQRIGLAGVAAILSAFSLMLAFSAAQWDAGDWRAYHVLIAALTASAGALFGFAFLMHRRLLGVPLPISADALPAQPSTAIPSGGGILLQYRPNDPPALAPVPAALASSLLACLSALSALALFLSLRAMIGDPQRPWWSVGCAIALSILWTLVAWWATAPRLLYAGGLLLNLAATLWCVEKPWASSTWPLLDLIHANAAVLAFSGLAAMVLQLQVFDKLAIATSRRLPFHRFAATLSTLIVLATAAGTTFGDAVLFPPHASGLLSWAAVGATTLLVAATLLWASAASLAAGELYVLGLAAIAIGIDSLRPPPNRIGWCFAVTLAGYVLLTGAIAAFAPSIRKRLGRSEAASPVKWLAPVNLIVAAVVLALSLWIDFTFAARAMRLASASAAVVQVFGLALAARKDARTDARQAALWIGTFAAVVWAWSWMNPAAALLERSVVLLVALVGATALFATLARAASEGSPARSALRNMRIPLSALSLAALLEIMGAEVFSRIALHAVAMHPLAIIAVLAILAGGAVLFLMLALKPALDPLQLVDSRRGAYVYAAEALLAIAFVHLRLTVPQLFGGIFAQYWPLLVMGLAFAGVGISEIFRRRKLPVLSDPLFRTGIFLPMLPALAYWILPPARVDYAYLLFTAGLLYAILSASRKSFAFGVLAALAANGGFWSMLAHEPQLGFLVHPQLWMIPAAVSVLVAAQLNAGRLSLPSLRAIRYACLSVVYVSSTADVFLNGVSRAPWLPMVLAALSVAGVLLGILFRMRAFLVLGTAFLSLALVTMIYYASANLGWTWLWYVAGIALGSAIIALFALFEKKRSEMLALVEGLKQWQ